MIVVAELAYRPIICAGTTNIRDNFTDARTLASIKYTTDVD
jgi:hypothetical protein